MKRITAAIAVLTASLVLAQTALAHPNVTGSASQACELGGSNNDIPTGNVILTASFSNAGFDDETTVTATDSGGAALSPPSGGSPYSAAATVPGPDRAAGTVIFDWTAGNDSGSVVAPYDAVSGCEAPPPPTTTTTTPPPPPSGHHTGGPPHISTAPHGHSAPPEAKAASQANAIVGGELPLTGDPVLPLTLIGLGLFGAGVALRRKQTG